MTYRDTPPDPPDYGDNPPCPYCGDTEWAYVAQDSKWENTGDGYDVLSEVLWECEVCHQQFWAAWQKSREPDP